MKELKFTCADEVIETLGQPILAQRKTLVRIRPAIGTEVFHRSYGDLTAIEGEDWILVPVDGTESYPCKKDIFESSWEQVDDTDTYRRKALCRIVQVPEGTTVILQTLEGETQVSYPDFIALGIKNEVYSHSQQWVNQNLTILS